MKTKIYFIFGIEGPSVCIGDIRIAGPKAWGGGKIINEWEIDVKDIVFALNNIFYPPHQPQKTLLDEINTLHDQFN